MLYDATLRLTFTDTSDQKRSEAEKALHESPARKQQARAEAEQQRALAQAAQREAEAQRQRPQGPNYQYGGYLATSLSCCPWPCSKTS